MENKAEFRINFKKYREHCKTNGIQIPRWMNHIIFNEVIRFMERGLKLQACKYLTEKSTENGTRNIDSGQPVEFGLKWSKNDVADVIESFRVVHHYEVPAPETESVSIDTIKEAIRPFAEIAAKYYGDSKHHHVSSDPNQVGIMTIKISDLRGIHDLYKKLNEYGEL